MKKTELATIAGSFFCVFRVIDGSENTGVSAALMFGYRAAVPSHEKCALRLIHKLKWFIERQNTQNKIPVTEACFACFYYKFSDILCTCHTKCQCNLWKMDLFYPESSAIEHLHCVSIYGR